MRAMTHSPVPSLDSLMAELPMVTLQISLHIQSHNLTVVVPESEWLRLVGDFKRMPADERQRLGSSIRNAVARDPFPQADEALDDARREACDAFVSDCMLLAALAEAVGPRVLTETVVDSYQVLRGNLARQRFN